MRVSACARAGCATRSTWAHRAERIANEIGDTKMLAHSSYLLMNGYGMLRLPEAMKYRTVPLTLFEQLGDLIWPGERAEQPRRRRHG